MSLQIWLPFNGDSHNQGLKTLPNPVKNNITYINEGKIGEKTGKGYLAWHLTEDFLSNNIWSVTSWIKQKSSFANYNNIIFCKNTSSANDSLIYFSLQENNKLNIGINSSSTLTYTLPNSDVFNINTWYHVGVTYDGTNLCLYLNGNKVSERQLLSNYTTAKLNMCIDGRSNDTDNTTLSNSGALLYLNDFRLYDHALSPKEIEEISKGLILHYPLNGEASNSNWLLSNADKQIIRSTSNTFIDYDYYSDLKTSSNTNWIVDFYAKGSVANMRLDIYFRSNDGAYALTAVLTLTTEWKHYSLSLSGNPLNLVLFRARCYGGNSGDIIYLRNMKLLSSEIPLRTNIIYDTSGYCNNGVILGELFLINPSPRYNIATYFNGDSSFNNVIKLNKTVSPIINGDLYTISFWIKPNNLSSVRSIYFGNYSTALGGLFIEKTADNKIRFYYKEGSVTKQYNIGVSNSLIDNEWNFITLVKNLSLYVYINGELISSKDGSDIPVLNSSNDWYVGRDTRVSNDVVNNMYVGAISDFRIYTTALSDSQITELYNTSMAIDAFGNVYARELVE